MKLSLVVTVKNEAKSVLPLLQSVEAQSELPDEIIIVDAGSTDQTVNLIKKFQARSKLNIKVFRKHGNRAVGRNFGIAKATGRGIAVTDAGCILDENWFKLITLPLNKVDVVAGFYHMTTDTLFTQCSALFVGVVSADAHKFLPSSRSIAFTKAAWAKIGGYPEHLDYAEDLIFAQKLKTGMIFEPRAWVEWTPPQNMFAFFTAIKNYTLGNVNALYWPHLSKNFLVAIRYILFAISIFALPSLVTLSFIPIYFLYTTIKFRNHLHHPLAPNLLFVLQLTADTAVIIALLQGLYDSLVQTDIRSSRN